MSNPKLEVSDGLYGQEITIVGSKLEMCIESINQEDIKEVHIVDWRYSSSDISFLKRCPNIRAININSAFIDDIDVLTELEYLENLTINKTKSKIELGKFKNLRRLSCGYGNVINLKHMKSLDFLNLVDYNPKKKDFKELAEMEFVPTLKCLHIYPSNVESLSGIERFNQLAEMALAYFKKLTDLAGIEKLNETLTALRIDDSKKIKNFELLSNLHKLEDLALCGDAAMESISFIQGMNKLKSFIFIGTDVLDGDLSYCEGLEHVAFTNKKHFSHKEKDFVQQAGQEAAASSGEVDFSEWADDIALILTSMYEYITIDGGDGYSMDDIEACGRILKDFKQKASACGGEKNKLLPCIKEAVLKLNQLNDQCDDTLVETSEREAICELILSAVNDAGLETDEDLTEKWREW